MAPISPLVDKINIYSKQGGTLRELPLVATTDL